MDNLSYEEQSVLQFAERAVDSEGRTLVTLVEDRNLNKDNISVVQVNRLRDCGIPLVMSGMVAEELSKIPNEHQHDELPFVLTGYLHSENNSLVISINQIHYFCNQTLDSTSAEYNERELVEMCEFAKNDAKIKTIPFVVIGHNHPKLENSRQNNLKIINNLSTQDLLVTSNLRHNVGMTGINPQNNVQYKGFNGFFATLMINHIGDLNLSVDFGNGQFKISDINYLDINGQIKPIGEYKQDVITGKAPLGVYTDPVINYDIDLTTEKVAEKIKQLTGLAERVDV